MVLYKMNPGYGHLDLIAVGILIVITKLALSGAEEEICRQAVVPP